MLSAPSLLQAATSNLRQRGELAWRGDFTRLDPDQPLSSIGIDSIEWMNLLLELESLAGFPLHNSELAGLNCVGDLLALLDRKLGP
jgi:acyl carrier protein